MGSDSASPYKPWRHQRNHSSFSLIVRGMVAGVPQVQSSRRASQHYEPPSQHLAHIYTQPLPAIPASIPSNQYWNERTMTWKTPIHRAMTASRRVEYMDPQPEPTLTRTPRTSRRYFREGVRAPAPALTQSLHKILQLTGFDPRIEMALPEQHEQTNRSRDVSLTRSNYSESVYDLYDESDPIRHSYTEEIYNTTEIHNYTENYRDVVQGDESWWSSGDSSPVREHMEHGILQPFYKLGGQMADAISSVTSLRHRDHSTKAQSKQMKQNEIATLRDLLDEERARQDEDRKSRHFEDNLDTQCGPQLTDADIANLVPRPLVLRPKNNKKILALDTKSSLLQNTLDPAECEINEMIASMNRTKVYNTPVTPTFDENLLMPKKALRPTKLKYKLFGTGNHPLKSPFPFRQVPDIPMTIEEIGPSEITLVERVSGVMKHISLSPTSPKRTVISNGARRLSGPDTPIPARSQSFKGFFPAVETTMHKSGVHIQEALTKAKKTVRFKSPVKRKRESLKNRIVYIGLSDQSPGTVDMYER